MILNNDTKIDPGLAQNLAKEFNSKKVGMAVPKIYFYPGFEFHQDRYQKTDQGKVIWYAGGRIDFKNVLGVHDNVDEVDSGKFNKKKNVTFASGCCFLISRQILDKVGLFDDRYFLYLEDADLSQKVIRAGYKIVYQPKAKLWHKNAESTGGSGSGLQDYYFTRNQLIFGFRYAPFRAKLALMRQALRLIVFGRKWQKRGVIDFFTHKLGRGSYPVRN